MYGQPDSCFSYTFLTAPAQRTDLGSNVYRFDNMYGPYTKHTVPELIADRVPSILCMAGRLFAFDTHDMPYDREETENRSSSPRLCLRLIQHENLLRPELGFRPQLLRHDRCEKERDSGAGSGMC